MRYSVVVLALLPHVIAPSPVAAQYSAEVESEASRIANTTMSPFCPGRTIATCPSPQAAELKRTIKAKLAAGVTPDSVLAELYATYGDVVRAAPAAKGFGLFAWVTPGIALLAGLSFVFFRLRRVTAARAVPLPELTDADRQRLDAELSQL